MNSPPQHRPASDIADLIKRVIARFSRNASARQGHILLPDEQEAEHHAAVVMARKWRARLRRAPRATGGIMTSDAICAALVGALIGIAVLGMVFGALSFSPIYTPEYWAQCEDRCGDFAEPYHFAWRQWR